MIFEYQLKRLRILIIYLKKRILIYLRRKKRISKEKLQQFPRRIDSGIYRLSCRLYLLFFNEVWTTSKFFFLVSLVVLATHSLLMSPGQSVVVPIISVSLIIFYFILANIFRIIVSKNSRNSLGKYIISRKSYLKVPDEHIPLFQIMVKNTSLKYRYAIPLIPDLIKIHQLTDRRHRVPISAKKMAEIVKRANGHIFKNNYSILFIQDKFNSPIGLTHVVPVNYSVWDRYKSGLISNRKFSKYDISNSSFSNTGDHPYGLIILSAFISRQFPHEKKENMSNDIELVMQALTRHIHDYAEREFCSKEYLPVLFTTMHIKTINAFKKYMKNGRNFSKEGQKIICIHVKNPSFSDQAPFLNQN